MLDVHGMLDRHIVPLVLFGRIHNARGHPADFIHELFARETALFNLRELVLPLTGEFRIRKRGNSQAL